MKNLIRKFKKLGVIVLLLFAAQLNAQNSSGFYLNWNIDHTERTVKPSIPIGKEEAKKNMYAYYVILI